MKIRAEKLRSVRRGTAAVALLILFHCAQAQRAAAQQLTFERARVLASYSRVVSKDVPFSIGEGIGKVAEVFVARREALTLRLHFVVHAAPPRPTWALVVRDGDDRVVWSHSPADESGTDFWSDELRGGIAKVEVYSTEVRSVLRLSIDKIAVSAPVTRPEAITPPDGRAPIRTQSERIRDLAQAVARLRFIGDDDTGYYCTGVLVAPDLLMTNYHCPQSDGERRSTLVDFDFDSDGAAPKTLRLKNLVIGDRRLDFAIYRLSGALADRSPVKLDEGDVVKGQALVLIQHPEGQPKQVSILDCRVSETARAGSPTDFGHLCDTLGGSSGSPVLDERTGLMLGLHHIGFSEESRRQVNGAVLLKHIADYVRSRGRLDLVSALGLSTSRRRAAPARRRRAADPPHTPSTTQPHSRSE